MSTVHNFHSSSFLHFFPCLFPQIHCLLICNYNFTCIYGHMLRSFCTSLMWLVMFSWDWLTHQGLVHEEHQLFLSQQLLITCIIPSKCEALWHSSPIPIGIIFKVMFRQPNWWVSLLYRCTSLSCVEDTILQKISHPGPLALIVFPNPSSSMFPNP